MPKILERVKGKRWCQVTPRHKGGNQKSLEPKDLFFSRPGLIPPIMGVAAGEVRETGMRLDRPRTQTGSAPLSMPEGEEGGSAQDHPTAIRMQPQEKRWSGGGPAENIPASCSYFWDSISSGVQSAPDESPGLYKYISEQLEEFLPSLHFQKATVLQEARLEQDPKPSAHW